MRWKLFSLLVSNIDREVRCALYKRQVLAVEGNLMQIFVLIGLLNGTDSWTEMSNLHRSFLETDDAGQINSLMPGFNILLSSVSLSHHPLTQTSKPVFWGNRKCVVWVSVCLHGGLCGEFDGYLLFYSFLLPAAAAGDYLSCILGHCVTVSDWTSACRWQKDCEIVSLLLLFQQKFSFIHRVPPVTTNNNLEDKCWFIFSCRLCFRRTFSLSRSY